MMCDHCAKHGKGKKWFLKAQNFSQSLLENDKDRQGFFDDYLRVMEHKLPYHKMSRAYALAKAKAKLFGPIVLDKYYSNNHFGQVVSKQEAGALLDVANDVVLLNCYCRQKYGHFKEACCLGVGAFADFVENKMPQDKFKVISCGDAKELVEKTERNNFFHSAWAFKPPMVGLLCNCDARYCTGTKWLQRGAEKLVKGHFTAVVDPKRCNACGECAKACPFNAITISDSASINSEKCMGCGLCEAACEQRAINLSENS